MKNFMILQNSKSHSKRHKLCPYECDKNGNLRIVTLMNILQNSAQEHIHKVGYGVEELAKQSLGWMTTKYDVRVKRFPKANETITVTTWISGLKELSAIREFLIKDSKGQTLVEVVSKWALIDLTRKKPVSLPKFKIWEKSLFKTNFAQSALKTIDFSETFPVSFDFIDFNQHVNNALYPLWASETVDIDFRLWHCPQELKISFQREALYGERIIVNTQIDDLLSNHVILSEADGRELAKVTCKWIKLTAFTDR
jgi:medium-chain acyl-[acyl-carrier-protein] hydrolase